MLVGALWGVVSVYASLGLATLPGVALWQKFLILPVVIAGWVLPESVGGSLAIASAILVGVLIGMLVDAIYKPKE